MDMQKIVSRFVERSALIGALGVTVYDNPTEEIVETLQKGKDITLYAGRGRGRALGRPRGKIPPRLEENYLFSTRRFPQIATNTFAAALNVGSYAFFTAGMGQDGQAMGFPTGFALTDVETNMEGSGGTVSKGSNFVFNQIGVSFNSDIGTADCAILMDAGALRFAKAGGQFSLNHGPVRLWPGGTGIAGFAETTAATTTIAAAHNGGADIRSIRKLTIPRVIRQTEQFSYTYFVPRATDAKTGTAIAMTAFALMTVWLWGATQQDVPLS